MSQLSLINYLKEENLCVPVNLFVCAEARPEEKDDNNKRPTSPRSNHEHTSLKNNNFRSSVIVDSEFCLDRLYGGYYSDWASGGQWNRMVSYVANLSKACRTNGIQLTVAFRGGLEKEYQESIFQCNREFKERLNRVILHLQNRGTPPPKVWWLPPTGLREVLCLAFHVYGVPVLFSDGDYYTDVMAYIHANNLDGLLTDDPAFALFNPPRLFGAHDFKLTYKGSLETKEYLLHQLLPADEISKERLPLLASLLGNHIVSLDSLKPFHIGLRQAETSESDSVSKSSEDSENATINKVMAYVKGLPDPTDIDSIAHTVYADSNISIEEGLAELKQSIQYYETFNASQKSVSPSVVTTQLDVQPVKSDGKHRKKNAVINDEFEVEEVVANGQRSHGATESLCQSNGDSSSQSELIQENGVNGLVTETANLSVDDKPQTPVGAKLHITVTPGDAILKLAVERHSKGLMAPIIVQSLRQREVRLQCYIEDAPGDTPYIIEIYRPVRQSVYAILHNLNKHLYDTRKIAEEQGNTVNADDISITMVEHYLGPLGVEVSHEIKVKPVPWPVPSIESLWLGVKPENKQRRMKAFLSCMNVGTNPFMSNPDFPEIYLLISCVLRYLLKCEPMALTVDEVDAVLSMATSAILFDVQTMQDMQLPVITTRGAHIASVVMAGIQHAILVNDTCGAPIRKQSTFPWLYFDGKLLQYKLLRNGSGNMQRIDLCDGNMEQAMMMERLRQAVLFGMENKLGEQAARMPFSIASALPGGRMFATPAFFRPFMSTGRGKSSLMGEFAPVNARLDGRGGKLQVAGQVVATWGPRPGSNRDNNRPVDLNSRSNGYRGSSHPPSQHRSYRRRQGYSHNRPVEAKNKNQNANQSNLETKVDEEISRSVVIVTKDELEDDEPTTDVIVTKQSDELIDGVKGDVIGRMNGVDASDDMA